MHLRQPFLPLLALLLWSGPASFAQVTQAPVPYGGSQPSGFIPDQVDLWTAPSVTPGQPLKVHVSSPTPDYTIELHSEIVAGNGEAKLLKTFSRTDGADRRSEVTWDAVYGTARAPWPAAFSIDTAKFRPGIYSLKALDGAGKRGGTTIFVVRTPYVDRRYPLFALSILTYHAYNAWGGASLYGSTSGVQGAVISLNRPYLNSRFATVLGWKGERAFIAWLATQVKQLQFTTDYDLSLDPTRDYVRSLSESQRRPRLLILGQHTEYVSKAMRDWIDLHVMERGDMNLFNFGANALYWQIRLQPSPIPGGMDVVCYKDLSDPVLNDPLTQATATLKWRSTAVGRPESKVLGAQYYAMVKEPGAFVITPKMPQEFLEGTGWSAGTSLPGSAGEEADIVDRTTSSAVIATAHLLTNAVVPIPFVASMVYRRPTKTSRVVNIGSLEWVKGYTEGVSFGVSQESFVQFNTNLLRWAGAIVNP